MIPVDECSLSGATSKSRNGVVGLVEHSGGGGGGGVGCH